jgi:Phage P22-like portal protein
LITKTPDESLVPKATAKEKLLEGTPVDVLENNEPTEEDYVPEGFETREAFLKDMREEYLADVSFDKANRDEAIKDKQFAAGEHWDPADLAARQGLPCLTIDTIPQFTAQIVGDWRESRKGIKVVPSNDEDTDVANIRGDIIRAIEMESRASRVYDSAFESMIQCGDGALRVAVEYARDDVFDQNIRIKDVEDALSCVWDRYSFDPTGRDAKRVFVDDRIPIKEFNKKYPEKTPDMLMGGETSLARTLDNNWGDHESYRVTEYWRLIKRRRMLAMFQTGQVFEVTKDNASELTEKYGMPTKTRVAWVSFAQMHLCTGFEILEGPFEYRLNRLPIVRMSGRVVNVGGRRIRHGIIRAMKDPARMKDFWRSIAMEQLAYSPKAKFMVTESAVEGREDTLRRAHLTRDPLLIFPDEAVFGQNVIPVPPPPVQSALLNEAQINAQDMKDVTGIHDASLGVRSNETSGRAIQARQREGDIAALTYFDNGNAAVLEVGDVINQLFPIIFDATRILRRIGEDGAVKFQKINDPFDPNSVDLSVGIYDVALTTGSSYSTKRVEAAQSMMDAVQVFPQLMQIAGDYIVKAQNWEGASEIADRIRKSLPENLLSEEEKQERGDTPPTMTPEQIQQGQMRLQELEEKVKSMEADKSISIEKLKIDYYNAETLRIKALSDHDVDANNQSMQAVRTIIDGARNLDEQEIRLASLAAKYEQQQQQQQQLSAPAGPDIMASPAGPPAI